MKVNFDVIGMSCSACSAKIEKSVGKMKGVKSVTVNLLTNSMQVDLDENIINADNIITTVKSLGYDAIVKGENKNSNKKGTDIAKEDIKNMKFRLIVSFAFLIPLMYISMGHMMGMKLPSFLEGMNNAVAFAFTQFLLSLPIAFVNRKYYINGFKSLFKGSPNMDSLIAIGSSAAFVYGIFAIYMISYGIGNGKMDIVSRYHMDLYFESGATILALITFGKYLEAKSKGRTSDAITKLINLAPKTAVVLKEGKEITVPVENVMTDDILIVKPGGSIPVDGVITKGSTTIDESAITGESIPVEKKEGDIVMTSTINTSGTFEFKATKVGDDTTLANIIRLVEEASSSKAPIAKLADKISGIFVPTVIMIALIASIIWLIMGATFEFALSIGISVLVVSCPCALGLATPVAIMVGTGKGAESGILIKSGEALEVAHNVDTVVLDKTGTITKGKPTVSDIIPVNTEKKELIDIAYSLETNSEHPLAKAVTNIKNATKKEVTDFKALFGSGVEGKIDGKMYYGGNLRLIEEKGLSIDTNILDKLTKEGKTPLIFADESEVIGIIAVMDKPKENSKAAIKLFNELNIDTIMLTGDNKNTAEAIKEKVGISKVIAQVLPEDKEKEVAKLQKQGKTVAMIGDGINDAPSLARADIGIAIGAGTDVAIESADIVLMNSDLIDAATSIKLSKAVIKNIKQNLFWAFFYNSIGIPLACGILYNAFNLKLNPMFAAAAMSLSSVCVVTNALRLKAFKPYEKNNNKINTKEKEKMEKKIYIDGMMCEHCKKSVTDALVGMGLDVKEVNLDGKFAVVSGGNIDEEKITQVITDKGYEVKSFE